MISSAGVALALFVAVLFTASTATAQTRGTAEPGEGQLPAASEETKYAPGRVIVRFRAAVPIANEATAHSKLGAKLLRRFHSVPGLQVVQLPSGLSVEDALYRYRTDPNIAYAEPDRALHVLETIPNDPSFSSQWALKNSGQTGGKIDADIDAADAWSLSTGSKSVYVGVIDTGVDYTHPDLSGNIYSSISDCNQNGVDDDGDDYIDNCHGIDTVNHDSDPMDDNGHGSHVSGIIGATGNNQLGVVGVNWRVSIVPCKFLGASGSGLTSGAIECLDWIAALRDHGLNIVATNNSWGGAAESSQALSDAIEASMQRGILFIVAAGNGGTDNLGDDNDEVATFPANYGLANVIAVAATDCNDLLGSLSNYGQHTVHLGAPGIDILSTIPANSYASLSGTSMATPHVSGASALLKAQNSSVDWRAIRNLLLSSAESISALSGKTMSGGRLNVFSGMTCSNRPLLSPVLPYGDSPVVLGSTITFSAMNINCAEPAGDVNVSIDNGAESLTLHDFGSGGDAVADDGLYGALWTPASVGSHTYTFQGGIQGVVRVLAPYNNASSVSYSYRSIAGTNLQLSDEGVSSVDLNGAGLFPVTVGGVIFNTISIAANGVLSFNNFGEYDNQAIPNSRAQLLIAPWWDDLAPQRGTDQNVFYAVTGTAPNRELVIEWRKVPHYATTIEITKTVTFQVVFPESSLASDILFNYANVNFEETSVNNAGGSATVGVQADPTHGVQYSYNQPALTNGLALLFQSTSLSERILTVTLAGTGAGTVAGPDINCGTDCSSTYPSGTQVTLTATPAAGSVFTGWSGVCSGTGSCNLTMDTDKTVAATFSLQTRTLTVTLGGTGAGTVTGPDINCGTDCSGTYPSGTQVTLTAVPAEGSAFTGWGGTCSGSGSCTVTMDADKTTTATFSLQTGTLTVTLAGTGVGTVTGPDINCGTDCSGTYPSGTQVTLKATPAAGSAFTGWGGACSGIGSCTVTMDTDKTAIATFSLQTHTLTVTLSGTGTGTVTGPEINCGPDCSGTYSSGTQVTLTATPASGSVFTGWSGACSGSASCTITMDAEKNVTATFNISLPFEFGIPPAPATVTAGQTAGFQISLNGQQGFTGSVSLSCSSGVPPAAMCSFNPVSVSLQSGAASSTLLISTTARTTAWNRVGVNFAFASLIVPLVSLGSIRRLRRVVILATVLVVAAIGLSCGTSGAQDNPPVAGTPPGTYSITVSASSGTTTRTQVLTLVVN